MPDPTTQPEHAIRFIGESSNRKPRYHPANQPAFSFAKRNGFKRTWTSHPTSLRYLFLEETASKEQ
ncbi:unnamed protein product [Mucor fragilis]